MKVLERRREIIEEIVIDPQNLPMTVISKSEQMPVANQKSSQTNEDPLAIKSADIDDNDEEAKRSSDLVYSSSDETKLKIQKTQIVKFKWTKSWLFIFPACCDVAGSSLLYVGLSLTSASSYQMIRGSTIIFTGLASRVFLRKHLFWYKWVGMLIILIGLFFVGSSDLNIQRCTDSTNDVKCDENEEKIHSILGDTIILGACIVLAFQVVFEEKLLKKYDIAPLEAVGWEGFYGFSLYTTILAAMAHIGTSSKEWGHSPLPPFYLEDALDGLVQLGNDSDLLLVFCLIILSLCVFVVIALTITQELSATTRTVIDSLRTLNIWAISLGLGWQQFHFLQVQFIQNLLRHPVKLVKYHSCLFQPIGFLIIITGVCFYYDALIMPYVRKHRTLDRRSLFGKKLEHIDDESKNKDSATKANKV